jgi:hypothetical protein
MGEHDEAIAPTARQRCDIENGRDLPRYEACAGAAAAAFLGAAVVDFLGGIVDDGNVL